MFVFFHTINKPIPTNMNEISMEFVTVQRAKTFKYLGITLDETVNWGEHAEAICSSLLKYFGIFNKIRYKVTRGVARQIYFAFIFSKIKYGIGVCGNRSTTNLNKIQVMQNTLMKLLLNIDRLTPTDTLHQTLNIWNYYIYQVNILSFVNDIVSGRCPSVFQDYFELKQNTYDLRTKGQIIVPPDRIVLADKQIRIKGAQLLNRLPKYMLESRFKKSFKTNLTKKCMASYTNWSCTSGSWKHIFLNIRTEI